MKHIKLFENYKKLDFKLLKNYPNLKYGTGLGRYDATDKEILDTKIKIDLYKYNIDI